MYIFNPKHKCQTCHLINLICAQPWPASHQTTRLHHSRRQRVWMLWMNACHPAKMPQPSRSLWSPHPLHLRTLRSPTPQTQRPTLTCETHSPKCVSSEGRQLRLSGGAGMGECDSSHVILYLQLETPFSSWFFWTLVISKFLRKFQRLQYDVVIIAWNWIFLLIQLLCSLSYKRSSKCQMH